MRILFWADGFWPRIGGAETQMFQFAKGMQERGHECIILTQKCSPMLADDETFQGIRIRRLNFNAIIQHREMKMCRLIKECLEEIRTKFQPEIIYLNTLENGSAFAFLLFHKMFNVPTVVTIHTPYYQDTVHPLVKQICEQAEHVCAASKWAYGIMKKLLPSLKNPLKMIYYGLSIPKTTPSPLPFSPSTILLLGRLSWEKGFDTAIFAFDLLQKKGFDAQLLIAGEGPERRALQDLANQLDSRDSIQFTGGLLRDGDSVFSAINQATFTVMPSLFEAFGLAALEAMQMGRPVIASDVGGLPEIIFHGERGLLVPLQNFPLGSDVPKNESSLDRQKWNNIFREKQRQEQEMRNQAESAHILCHAMEALLKNREETIQMGSRAREWASKTYLLEENLNQYEELFKQCL